MDDLDAVWAQIKPMLKAAIQKGDGRGYNIESLYNSAKQGSLHLLVIHNGPIVACVGYSIQDLPAAKAMTVCVMGGSKMDEWLDQVITILQAIKLENKADYMEAYVRKGLSKILNKKGWKTTSLCLEAP